MNNLMSLKDYQREVYLKNKQIAELYVVIDTLQTNLRAAVSHLSEEDKDSVTKVQSFQWCTNWKPGQEKD
jgi:Na+/phosphate symporter